jgi:hypothetical protein
MNLVGETDRYRFRELITGWSRRFFRSEHGAVMIYVAALLPFLVAGGLVVVDGARLYNLQTLLQNGADSLAIAAARELDGRANAIARAQAAMANLLDNKEKFGTQGAATITVSTQKPPRFLSALPDSDDIEIDASLETSTDSEAQFIEVTVEAELNTIFPAQFFNSVAQVHTWATAVAGFNLVACDYTPVFICNPFEDPGLPFSIVDVATDPSLSYIKRRQIILRQYGGGTSQYSPGNYGFLQPLQNPGADALRDMIGMTNPPTCFLQNGVTLRPGFVATVRDALNVRFDMYNGPMNASKSNPDFRPAQNVRKGMLSESACNPVPDNCSTPVTRKLGRDFDFPYMDNRMGNGEWDFDDYWQTNFPGIDPPGNQSGDYQCNATTCTNPPSRYDVYRDEISRDLHLNSHNVCSDPGNDNGERGLPRCSTVTPTADPDRRLLFGAVINCVEQGITGGASGPYPVEAFVSFFVTEPVPSATDDIIIEIADVFEPGGGGAAPDIRPEVQLYR